MAPKAEKLEQLARARQKRHQNQPSNHEQTALQARKNENHVPSPPSPARRATRRSRPAESSLEDQLDALKVEYNSLVVKMGQRDAELSAKEEMLVLLRGRVTELKAENKELRASKDAFYNELRTLRAWKLRHEASEDAASNETTTLRRNLADSTRQAAALSAELQRWHGLVAERDHLIQSLRSKARDSAKTNKALSRKLSTTIRQRQKTLDLIQTSYRRRNLSLMSRGTYTPATRALVRRLYKFGCAQDNIGPAIRAVLTFAGLEVKRVVSGASVRRFLIEGGIATRVQVPWELGQADAVVVSGDATSHKSRNYESMHGLFRVPNYTDLSAPKKHALRFLSLDATESHTSEAQVAKWKSVLDSFVVVYNRCPFSKRTHVTFTLPHFLDILKGAYGDHANDQKKTVRLLETWKQQSTRTELGLEKIAELTLNDPEHGPRLRSQVHSKCIDAAGGFPGWMGLSDGERAERLESGWDQLAFSIGEEVFASLSEEEQQDIDLFFWAGCSMHKELNSVVGFMTAGAAYWEKNGLPPPALLLNKDNDEALALAEEIGAHEIAERAKKVSERGAIKFLKLCAIYFRNVDDKKGVRSEYFSFFSEQFAAIAASRYQSNAIGAAMIIKRLEEHKTFMLTMRDKKTKPGFNHLEANIYKGLCCPFTLTEECGLVMLHQTVNAPYARIIRGDDSLNMLEQGPLHERLKQHIRNIQTTPALVFGTSLDGTADPTTLNATAVFEGGKWDDLVIVRKIFEYIPTHPHIIPWFVHALSGSLETWERFTVEFEEDGRIAKATAAQRRLAFTSTTNDGNEAALARARKWLRDRNGSSIDHFMDYTLYWQNDTEAFMETMFEEEDHAWVRAEARRVQSSGLEKQRQGRLRLHLAELAEVARKRQAISAQRKADRDAQLEGVELELDPEVFGSKMLDKDLVLQLRLWRRIDPLVPAPSGLNKAKKIEAIWDAIERLEGRELGENDH